MIGQTLAMEGMFAFFLESAFVGALVWGEKRLGPRNHFLAAVGVATGSWLSAYFILVTNAFMQHPVGYAVTPDGTLEIADIGAYLLNPWAMVQFAHNQAAAVVTGSFVVTAMGAFYTLRKLYPEQARLYLKYGTAVGLVASILVAYPPATSRPDGRDSSRGSARRDGRPFSQWSHGGDQHDWPAERA